MNLKIRRQYCGLRFISLLALWPFIVIGINMKLVFAGIIFGIMVAVLTEHLLRKAEGDRIVVKDEDSKRLLWGMADFVLTGEVDELSALISQAQEENRALMVYHQNPERVDILIRVLQMLCMTRNIEMIVRKSSGRFELKLGNAYKSNVISV